MSESIRKSILKISKLIVAAIIVTCFVSDILGLGTAADHRTHFFAVPGEAPGTVQLADEGFRWRNSFNFTIDLGGGAGAQNVAGNNWFFNNNGLIDQNGMFINPMNPGMAQIPNIGFIAGTQSDDIHQSLSTIANGILNAAQPPGGFAANVPNLNHIAVAAITIVVQNPNNAALQAYTEVVNDHIPAVGPAPEINATAVALPIGVGSGVAGGGPNIPHPVQCNAMTALGTSMYYTNTKVPGATLVIGGAAPANIRANVEHIANNLIGANIPANGGGIVGGDYTCCEGQIISRLFDANPPVGCQPLFPTLVNRLLGEANDPAHLGGAVAITDGHIRLVVFHIHSRRDACAKCSRVLSGLSRQMNMPAAQRNNNITALLNVFAAGVPIHGGAAAIPALTNFFVNLGNGNARFLIEMSSDLPYGINNAHCSCAELAGHDGNQGGGINIQLGAPLLFNSNGALASPYNNKNWTFPIRFPPYVVYARTGAGGVAAPALAMCGAVGQAHPVGVPLAAQAAAGVAANALAIAAAAGTPAANSPFPLP
jgi:hypothetical protein